KGVEELRFRIGNTGHERFARVRDLKQGGPFVSWVRREGNQAFESEPIDQNLDALTRGNTTTREFRDSLRVPLENLENGEGGRRECVGGREFQTVCRGSDFREQKRERVRFSGRFWRESSHR